MESPQIVLEPAGDRETNASQNTERIQNCLGDEAGFFAKEWAPRGEGIDICGVSALYTYHVASQ